MEKNNPKFGCAGGNAAQRQRGGSWADLPRRRTRELIHHHKPTKQRARAGSADKHLQICDFFKVETAIPHSNKERKTESSGGLRR